MSASRQGGQQRQLDTILIENPDVGVFETFNAVRITNDLTRPSEASFDVGNDSSYNEFINEAIAMGSPFRVWVNERLHLTGRVEYTSVNMTAAQGAPMQFVVRTKLADALYGSANPDVRAAKGTSIKDFVLAVYAPLGFVEDDFIFQADVSRDILTGRPSDGSDAPVPIDDLKEEQLKVHPPETMYAAVDRILKRHGLMHWDAPDGKIVIGAPNNDAYPLFDFRMFNDRRSQQNNLLACQRTRDYSQAPAILGVYGVGGKKNWLKSKVSNVQLQHEVYDILDRQGDHVFYRPVLVINEGVKTDELAERHALRELTNRSKSIDTWRLTMDGLSYWDGVENIPVGPDTVANVETSLGGGPVGRYLVTSVTKSRTATEGDKTDIDILKQGLWVL